jgi:DNA-binding response OmpR family regulator
MGKPSEWATGSQRIRVLVVDDEPDLRTTIERMLRRHADVTTAATVDEAMAALSHGEYDAMVCDYGVVGAPGGERWNRLEEQVPTMLEHLLVMSGGGISAEDQAVLDELADRLLLKPFRMDALLAALRRVAQR